MYVKILITDNKCPRGLQTFECPARDELLNQNLLHVSAADPKEALVGNITYTAGKPRYDEILTKLPQICAICPHNRSK